MIWDFERTLVNRLLLWAGLSVATGLGLLLCADAFWRGVGLQAIAWGLVDGAIALLGRYSSQKRRLARGRGADPAEDEREATRMRRLLWINSGLDVMYVAGGLAVVFSLGGDSRFLLGTGWGIVIQGGFLFFFDLIHARGVPERELPLPPLNLFTEPEHQPFRLEGGTCGGALLVHGFGGTPAEMLGIGEALHARGWTVEALLLPGFGSDIATLPERRYSEWLGSVEGAVKALREAGGNPLLLVGYSMGATLSIVASAALHPQPDGLVLLAPFWWHEKPWLRVMSAALRPLLPGTFRPFRRADFKNPRLREGLAKFLPGGDLEDPETQRAVRDFPVPLVLIDQVISVSRLAYERAAVIGSPVLIVQGERDETVRPRLTRKLAARFGGPIEYLEVDSGHDLTRPSNPAWPAVRDVIGRFATGLGSSAGAELCEETQRAEADSQILVTSDTIAWVQQMQTRDEGD